MIFTYSKDNQFEDFRIQIDYLMFIFLVFYVLMNYMVVKII